MIIRESTVADAQEMKNLHERSVLELCSADYSPEQLEEWVNSSPLAKYQSRLVHHRSFIAEIGGIMVGYARWNPATNELCSIFVHPEHVRQGIATELMQIAYEDAQSFAVKELWLDASLTAVPFYEAEGWNTVGHEMHGPLECVRMTKALVEESTNLENQ